MCMSPMDTGGQIVSIPWMLDMQAVLYKMDVVTLEEMENW